jgi:hypothetical protein
VDAQLQPIVKDQALYFKNSFTLKADLDGLDIPPNASLFTYDAVAMYPSINMAQCLERLLGYLSSPNIASYYGINPTALIEAIAIVMYNNCMRFGNVLVKQISGIAMGMSPVPTLANLFVAIYEHDHVLQYIPAMVKYRCRFIDDGFGIWLHDPDPEVNAANWKAFQDYLNKSGLKWIFSKRSNKEVFMDLRIKIVDHKIITSLYAKPLALHL